MSPSSTCCMVNEFMVVAEICLQKPSGRRPSKLVHVMKVGTDCLKFE